MKCSGQTTIMRHFFVTRKMDTLDKMYIKAFSLQTARPLFPLGAVTTAPCTTIFVPAYRLLKQCNQAMSIY